MKLKSVLANGAAATALCLAMPAHADHAYVSLFGGFNSLNADDIRIGPFSYSTTIGKHYSKTILATDSPTKWSTRHGYLKGTTFYFRRTNSGYTYAVTYVGGFNDSAADSGFVIGGALGMDFDDGWRAEIEIAWRKNDIGERHHFMGTFSQVSRSHSTRFLTGEASLFTPSGSRTATGPTFGGTAPFTDYRTWVYSTGTSFTATAKASGEVQAFSVMANVWYDWDLGEGNPIHPFVGAGVGAVDLSVKLSGHAVLPTNTAVMFGTYQNTAKFATDTDDWTWGWQAGAGLAYEFGNGMSLSAQYRYFSTGNITVAGRDYGVSSNELLFGLIVPLGQ